MTTTDVPDTIERSVPIDAPAEIVWSLVSEPGWWINDGAIVAHEIREQDDHVVVTDPVHGEFRLRSVLAEPPHRVHFEWLGDEGGSTTVELTIAERPGGVTLTVVERGFASLPGGPAARAKAYEGNVAGWATELDAAARHCAADRVECAVYVGAAPETVWPLVATGEGLAGWYAFGGATLDARPGGAATLHWDEHGTFRATVEAVDAPHTLTLRIATEPDADPTTAAATAVRLSVTAAGDGSVVAVRQDGFEALGEDPATLAAQERAAWDAGLGLLAGLAR